MTCGIDKIYKIKPKKIFRDPAMKRNLVRVARDLDS